MKLFSIAILAVLFSADLADAQCSNGSYAVPSSGSRTVSRSVTREGGRVRLFRPFARLRGRCG